MGLYEIQCPQCKKMHLWFSGISDQRCEACMTSDKPKAAPREWWIASYKLDDFILNSEPFGTHASKYVRVIEHDAFIDAQEYNS